MEVSRRRVLGVLAGGDLSPLALAAWARSADLVLAADGGADRLREAGVPAEAAIGDFDSIGDLQSLRMSIHDADQEKSDCDKLLAWLASHGETEVTLAGVEGDRLDHVLGTLASAVRSPIAVRLVTRRGLGWIVKSQLTINAEPGDLISLLPLTRCRGVTLSGVEWPLGLAELDAQGLVSLSNRSTGSTVEVQLDTGAAVLFHFAERLEKPTWE